MLLREVINKTGYYRIRLIPNQSATELRSVMDDGTIKVAVKAPREKGKANLEMIRFFADVLSVRKNQIRISSGLTNPLKIVFIDFEE